MSSPTPLRRELLISLGILFGGVTLLLGISISLVLPFLRSTGETMAFILVIVAVDLVIVLTFGGWALKKNLLEPVDQLVRGVKQIADGDYRHRLELPNGLELRSITESVNAMADRLIAGQEVLAENVRSLDETNVMLIEARNEVIQAARLASVGTLAAGIAHEVGNPLTAIIGYADVALRRIEADQGDPELLELIRSEAHRIDGIVRGLLDFARPQSDEITPVRVDEVVAGVRELLETQGRLGQIEHSWTLDEECPPVLMDPRHLEQVLVNLLLNASDAVKDVDEPKIEVAMWSEEGPAANPLRRRGDDPPGVNYMHRRRVARAFAVESLGSLETAHRVVVVAVSDNGPGLPSADETHVFDPFFTTKEPGKGTGLGLFISARLVSGMGGRIDLENTPDGARFEVRLPEATTVKDSTVEQYGAVGARYSEAIDRQEVE
ncbi:MAG: HAMP domain-containing protein [Gemmatimonadetes bacterium]|nr:HAMP domain-containing protein [Gemmatimonadota bacterium]